MNPRLKAFRLAWLCFLTVGLLESVAAAVPVWLSEIVSSNGGSLRDEDGDSSDWVEIQNFGATSVNLLGCGLSDKPDQPFKWVFPSKSVASGGFLVVFASGKNRTAGSSLHTNFSISSEGEELLLTAADGTALDAVPAVRLRQDMSYARAVSSGGGWRFFTAPTPRAANTGASFAEVLQTAPAVSVAGGFYADPVSLTLSPTETGTIVRYTLDGSEPTAASPSFDSPLPIASRAGQANVLSMITGTATTNQHTDGWKPPVGEVRKATVVRARAFKADALPSPIATHTYFIGSAARHTDGLPVVSVATDTKGLFDYNSGIYMLGKVFADYVAAHPGEPLTGHTPANYNQRGAAWERPADIEFFDPTGTRAFAVPGAIDIKGLSSRSFRQKSFGIDVHSEGNPGQSIQYPLFPGLKRLGNGAPLEAFRHLRLRNCGNDWAYAFMRDGFCHQLSQGLGLPVMSWRPVSIYLDGEYWGVLEMREEEDPLYFEAHYEVNANDVVILSGSGTVDDGVPGDEQAYLSLRTFADTHDLSVPADYAHVAERMDVENFLLYQVMEVYFGNADWPQNNTRVWRQRRPDAFADRDSVPRGQDGRWRWMLFDLDLSGGHPWAGNSTENTLSYALSPVGRPGFNTPWATIFLRALMKNPESKRAFANLAADLLNSHLKETRATALVDSMKATLQPAMAEHIRRWQSNGNSISSWSTYVASLRTYASQRAINVRQHFTSQLNLGGYAPLTIAVEPAGGGLVRVNRLLITSDLPGAASPVYPWRGTYFRNVPVDLEAVPAPGYLFDGWTTPAGPVATPAFPLTLAGTTTVTARFVPGTFPAVEMTLSSPERLSDGTLRLVFQGRPNAAFELQFSSDLAAWQPTQAFTTDMSGRREFTLPPPFPGAAPGFYRVAGP